MVWAARSAPASPCASSPVVSASGSSKVNPWALRLTLGAPMMTPRRRHSAMASATLSAVPATEVRTAAMYAAG